MLTIEEYRTKINDLINEYLEQLTPQEREAIKGNVKAFNLMLIYVGQELPRVDRYNVELLSELFKDFRMLCFKFNINSTIYLFCDLINMESTGWSLYSQGRYSKCDENVKYLFTKLSEICKDDLVNDLSNSDKTSVNKIFIAKAAYQMRESTEIIHTNMLEHDNRSVDNISIDYNNFKRIPDPDSI